MAPPLCDYYPRRPLALAVHPVPRLSLEQHPRLHLVKAQQRHETELSRLAGIHSAISTLGLDGV